MEEVKQKLLAVGLEPVSSTANELATRDAGEKLKWMLIVKASGCRADE